MSLSGKVALVTGSSRSIGAAIVKRLAHDGAHVVVNYVQGVDSANAVVDEINSTREGAAIAIQADVSGTAGTKKLVEDTLKAFGRIDILVLNAGMTRNKPLENTDEVDYDDIFNTNVKGPLFLVKAASPHLTEGGRVIFLSTSITRMSGVAPEYLTYAASKGAVEQLSRVLARDLGRRGITVNTVSPGPVDTPMFREGKTEQAIQMFTGMHPAKRLGQPDDIAYMVATLSAPGAAWVNGQTILVNGGLVV